MAYSTRQVMPDPFHTLGRIKEVVKALPPVRAWRERSYTKTFVSDDGYCFFRGVFGTFDDAVRSAPTSKPISWDRPENAAQFTERQTRVYAYDYPVLFWLTSIFAPNTRVFDFGGHVGVQFYSYQKYLPFPSGLQWRVCDVAAVVGPGRELALSRGISDQLTFTTEIAEADGFDVLIAAGSLQYVEKPLAELLRPLARPPKHLLLNKLPLREGAGFVTLQNAGPAFVPQHVFSRKEFIDGLAEVGYELVDDWEDRERSCFIPFHPDKLVQYYSGVYLRRRADP